MEMCLARDQHHIIVLTSYSPIFHQVVTPAVERAQGIHISLQVCGIAKGKKEPGTVAEMVFVLY